MKKIFTALIFTLLIASCSYAEFVELPAPNKTGGMPLNEAVTLRRTTREFTDATITQQELSDLLYVAAGVNRDNGLRVYPVGKGVHDIDVYVFNHEGIYKFDAPTHSLEVIAAGDYRQSTGKPTYAGRAAVNLVYVQDLKAWEGEGAPKERIEKWGFAHTGAIAQGAYLFAASKGWNAVVRGTFENEKIRRLLNLTNKQTITLVQSIGLRP